MCSRERERASQRASQTVQERAKEGAQESSRVEVGTVKAKSHSFGKGGAMPCRGLLLKNHFTSSNNLSDSGKHPHSFLKLST